MATLSGDCTILFECDLLFPVVLFTLSLTFNHSEAPEEVGQTKDDKPDISVSHSHYQT